MSTDHGKKPLAEKLGFKPDGTVMVIGAPAWYDAFAFVSGFRVTTHLPATHAHVFCASQSELQSFIGHYDLEQVAVSLWISWPKRGSGVETNLGEQDLREVVLPLGWVDVKVARIDATWSALKFLRRKRSLLVAR